MAGITACLWYSGASSLAQNAAGTVAFDVQVKPTLAARCVACHSQEKRQGGLSLATYEDILNGGRSGAAVKPGKSASSLLMQRVTGEVPPRMPLGGKPLTNEEIAVIRGWIDEGARPTPSSAPAPATTP